MAKIKLLLLSISSAALAVNFFVYQQIMLGLAFAALSALLLHICIRKYRRDHEYQRENHVNVQRRLDQVPTSNTQLSQQVVAKSSRRLSVLPPLE